jgi:hypothetical protein
LFLFSGGLLLKQDVFCRGSIKQTNTLGVVILEVVPSGSGLAELDVRFEQVRVIRLILELKRLFKFLFLFFSLSLNTARKFLRASNVNNDEAKISLFNLIRNRN